MRRILVLYVLFLAGCLNIAGPFAPKQVGRPEDPRLSISEQEARVRDRWAVPDSGVKIGSDRVDPLLTPYR